MELEYESEALTITVKDEVITQISSVILTVSIGERVRSSGHSVRFGRLGTVTALYDPHQENSSLIIDVLWDGNSHSTRVKFKDLVWTVPWVM